jgi:hypothetical protein
MCAKDVFALLAELRANAAENQEPLALESANDRDAADENAASQEDR